MTLLWAQDTLWGSALGSEAKAAGQLWMNPGRDVLRLLCLPGPTVSSMLTFSDSAGWWPLSESLVKGGTV